MNKNKFIFGSNQFNRKVLLLDTFPYSLQVILILFCCYIVVKIYFILPIYLSSFLENMRTIVIILIFAVLHVCYAPPVTQNKEKPKEGESDGLEDYMEYHRYLREVVNALESDPEFRQKLEKANEEDIRSGKIAHELEFVSHNVRTRLDEIKRTELERLRHLMEKKQQLQENNDVEDPTHHHLDHSNPHTFEIEDLKKLIAKTTEDLAEADKKRREEFKEYEMQKEFEKQQKLNNTTGEERAKLEKELKVVFPSILSVSKFYEELYCECNG